MVAEAVEDVGVGVEVVVVVRDSKAERVARTRVGARKGETDTVVVEKATRIEAPVGEGGGDADGDEGGGRVVWGGVPAGGVVTGRSCAHLVSTARMLLP